jgi:hypothetical protein
MALEEMAACVRTREPGTDDWYVVYICGFLLLYICGFLLLYVCSHSTTYVFSASGRESRVEQACVLCIYAVSYCYMCPHSTIYVSSCYYICVVCVRTREPGREGLCVVYICVNP